MLDVNGNVTSNYEGLLLAFRRAAEGADDLEVAEALNAAGYRPSIRNKRGLFTRESVRVILSNRFYLGALRKGNRGKEGWEQAAHPPMIPQDLWDEAQRQRARRRKRRGGFSVPRTGNKYALSGLLRCAGCGGKLHTYAKAGKTRGYCYTRDLMGSCNQPSAPLARLEAQVEHYLETLTIPDDYQEIVLRALQAEHPEFAKNDARQRELHARLVRLRDLYEMGDLSRAEYEARRTAIRAELDRVEDGDTLGRPQVLTRLREYLRHLPAAWRDATPELRNQLARTLFEEFVVGDGRVLGAIPRAEYLPFFALDEMQRAAQESEHPRHNVRGCQPGLNERARGDSNPRSRP